MKRTLYILLLALGGFTHTAVAQLNVSSNMTAGQYVQELLGPGVSVSNVSYTGNTGQSNGTAHSADNGYYEFDYPVQQIGTFSNGASTNIGMDAGIILSTGHVGDAGKPASFFANSYKSSMPIPDNDLQQLSNGTTSNISVLEFDFVPQGPHISFEYVFASEEYPNWVGDNYNDVFGFFLSGPGINGPFTNNAENIAMVPGTTTPIAINDVNNGYGDCQPIFGSGGNNPPSGPCKNCQYYVSNCGGTTIAYGGFTTVMTSEYDVECGETYHIKIAIADVGDYSWDSALFLQKNSLISSQLSITPNPVTICEGEDVDLTAVLEEDDGMGTFLWEPTGETTETINVSPEETTEYVVTYNKNNCILSDTAMVYVGGPAKIEDLEVGDCIEGTYNLTGTITTTNPPTTGDLILEDCNGTQIVIASAPFDEDYALNLTDLTADGNDCTLSIYFSDNACPSTESFTAPAPCEDCVSPEITTNDMAACAGEEIDLNDVIDPSSDPADFTFYNSEQDANNATNPIGNTVNDEGTYWVRAENNNGGDCFTVTSVTITLNTISYTATLTNEDCGQSNGQIVLTAEEGEAPFTYSIDGGNTTQTNGTFENLPVGFYPILITDNNGCEVTGNENIGNENGINIENLVTTSPSCIDFCDGEASVTTSGSTGNVNYQWEDENGVVLGDNQATIDILCPGNYTIIVTDDEGCAATTTLEIVNPEEGTFTVSSTDPSCGNDDGEIVFSDLDDDTEYGVSYTGTENDFGPITKYTNSQGEIIINNQGSGSYTDFNINEVDGCPMSNDTTITLIEPGAPTVVAPEDITICMGESVTLTASNPDSGELSWDNNINDGQAFTPDEVGTYTYTVTASIENCSASDQTSVTVIAIPEPEFIGDILSGCSPLTVTFSNLTTGNNTNCVWDFGDGTTAQNCGDVTHTYTQSGIYSPSLTLQTGNGCEGSTTLTDYIEVTPKPSASFIADPMILTSTEEEVNFYNTSTNGEDYIWNYGDGSSLSNNINSNHTYDEPGSYIVSLIASNGEDCTDTVQVIVKVEDELIFYIPNTFTPDGNNYNETFTPVFTSGYDPYTYTLQIYNRWGELIFESHNAKIGWDGTYGGEVVQDGTYIWKIKFKITNNDEWQDHIGHINLLR